MDFLPWTTFARIVARYGGNHRIRTFSCTDHFHILAFAQLTYRESLCDIEACLTAQSVGHEKPLRRIRFKDPDTDKTLVFLTNNFTLPALTITELYRCRWQVELFFK
jgi:hypothetical protein